MPTRRPISLILGLTLILAVAACAPRLTPTATPSPTPTPTLPPTPTATPRLQAVTVNGPACPGPFREGGDLHAAVTLGVGDTLTLTLGSSPSIPCWWEPPTVADTAVISRVVRQSVWPAADVTPKPGAPSTEVWGFEAVGAGERTLTAACACRAEADEGTCPCAGGQDSAEILGTYVLTVTVEE